MTFQQRAIEFFTTTGEEWWMKSQVVEKLRDLAGNEAPTREGPSALDSQGTVSKELLLIDRRLNRLEAALPTLKPEISSPPDDDAPF